MIHVGCDTTAVARSPGAGGDSDVHPCALILTPPEEDRIEATSRFRRRAVQRGPQRGRNDERPMSSAFTRPVAAPSGQKPNSGARYDRCAEFRRSGLGDQQAWPSSVRAPERALFSSWWRAATSEQSVAHLRISLSVGPHLWRGVLVAAILDWLLHHTQTADDSRRELSSGAETPGCSARVILASIPVTGGLAGDPARADKKERLIGRGGIQEPWWSLEASHGDSNRECRGA